MIFFSTHKNVGDFEEEEEGEGGIDDALLGELDEDLEIDDDLLVDGLPPILKESEIVEQEEEEDDLLKEDEGKLFEDEDEDMDYDSFDDHDEM